MRSGPDIVTEAFDDEVIIVNLKIGKYFGLQREAGQIWRLAMKGAGISAISEAMQRLYAGEAAAVDRAVRGFLVRLQEQGLLVPSPEEPVQVPLPEPDAGRPRTGFVEPVMEIYDDLQDLLLLDPIHEVDDTGWPQAVDPSKAGKA